MAGPGRRLCRVERKDSDGHDARTRIAIKTGIGLLGLSIILSVIGGLLGIVLFVLPVIVLAAGATIALVRGMLGLTTDGCFPGAPAMIRRRRRLDEHG